MNGLGTALRRVHAAAAVAVVLGVLGVGTVGSTLAQGSPLRAKMVAQPAVGRRALSPQSAPSARASIVEGVDASITEFPFQVALYDPQQGSPASGFFCGGVILGPRSVATAAHCLIGEDARRSRASEIEVLAGSTYLEPTDPGSVRDPVVAVTADPSYSPSTSEYDVGMLRLARPLWSGVAPVADGREAIAPLGWAPPGTALATLGSAASSAGPAASAPTLLTVSGWGDVNPEPGEAPSFPMRLQKASVPLISGGLCAKAYAAIEEAITPAMICAGGGLEGAGRADSCEGDSGGPLVATGAEGAASPLGDVLVGLVDFGYGCAQAGYPGVYVRVADPAVAHFLSVRSRVASAGSVHHGPCPWSARRGHAAQGSRGPRSDRGRSGRGAGPAAAPRCRV